MPDPNTHCYKRLHQALIKVDEAFYKLQEARDQDPKDERIQKAMEGMRQQREALVDLINARQLEG